MYKKEVTVKSMTGFHARPGADIVKMALAFKSDIFLEVNGLKINSKEVLEVLGANVKLGDLVTVIAKGEDEREAVTEIAHYIETVEG